MKKIIGSVLIGSGVILILMDAIMRHNEDDFAFDSDVEEAIDGLKDKFNTVK